MLGKEPLPGEQTTKYSYFHIRVDTKFHLRVDMNFLYNFNKDSTGQYADSLVKLNQLIFKSTLYEAH